MRKSGDVPTMRGRAEIAIDEGADFVDLLAGPGGAADVVALDVAEPVIVFIEQCSESAEVALRPGGCSGDNGKYVSG